MNKILNYFKKNNTKEYTAEVTNLGDGLYILHYDLGIEKIISKEAIKIDMPQNLGETKKIKITYGR
jgi:hypothetical protein